MVRMSKSNKPVKVILNLKTDKDTYTMPSAEARMASIGDPIKITGYIGNLYPEQVESRFEPVPCRVTIGGITKLESIDELGKKTYPSTWCKCDENGYFEFTGYLSSLGDNRASTFKVGSIVRRLFLRATRLDNKRVFITTRIPVKVNVVGRYNLFQRIRMGLDQRITDLLGERDWRGIITLTVVLVCGTLTFMGTVSSDLFIGVIISTVINYWLG